MKSERPWRFPPRPLNSSRRTISPRSFAGSAPRRFTAASGRQVPSLRTCYVLRTPRRTRARRRWTSCVSMKEALTLVDNQAKVQNIEIRTHFPPEPCQVLGVPSLLEQVFINLLLNAMNAMPNGGTVDVFAEQAAGEVLLRVTDTGEGISQEDLDKIFDPFFTRAPLGKGTGLGLSICHSIVDQHGGSISVESQSGKGSTFTVKLPSLCVTEEKSGEPHEPDRPRRGRRP